MKQQDILEKPIHELQEQPKDEDQDEDENDNADNNNNGNHNNDNNNNHREDDELGDEDILDEEDALDLDKAIQLAVWRVEQLQAWKLAEKDKQIQSLQQRITSQDERIASQDERIASQGERIAMLQMTIEKQQKTLDKEVKIIRGIAKRLADERLGSLERTTTVSTAETPSEQPPNLPGRKPSQPLQTIQTQNKNQNPQLQENSSPLCSSSVPLLPQLPASTPNRKVQPRSFLNAGDGSTPPILPKRLQSSDVGHFAASQCLEDHSRQDSMDTGAAKIHAPNAFSSLSSGTEGISTKGSTPSHSVAITQLSQTVASNITLETYTDHQKPPERKLSARPDPSDTNTNVESVSRVHSYSTGFSSKTEEISLNDKGSEHSIDIIEAPKHRSQSSQEIAFVPTKQEITFLPPPPPFTETPRSVRTSKSIPVASRITLPFDGHATAPVDSFQQEIQFDAAATFPQNGQQEKSAHARTSVAHVRFDESQQLLLEASQALNTTAILTPSSVKLRKSLTKKSTKKSVKQKPEQEIVLSDPKRNFSVPISMATTASKEIEFSILEEPKKCKSVFEQHLDINFSEIGESIQNKTEEQILQEKVFGKAAVATPEDEEDDEYDYFDDVGTVDLPFTNKGYLEYSKDLNLSPVSCLTTVSNMRENQVEEDEEAMGPRKALHNAGVAKRLPMEDGFDSDDDDDDEKEGRDAAKNDEKEDQLTPSSSQNKKSSSSHGSLSTENQNSNASMNASQSSLPIDATSQTGTPRPSARSKRSNKPVVRVDNDVIQDKYGDEGKYTGTVAMDTRLPHGYGQMKYDNERQYDGEWKGGRWHGYGRWVNPNGDCYEGTFDYDARHGRGVYTWRNGNVYRGDFHEDKRQGKGAFHFANGNVFEGDFVNGVFHGEGLYKFDGGSYEGGWKDGKYHGNGLLIFADGSSYNGEFLDGVAHGQGEEKGPDGTIRRGIWDNGRPQAVW